MLRMQFLYCHICKIGALLRYQGALENPVLKYIHPTLDTIVPVRPKEMSNAKCLLDTK